jgi:hypothetical protein
VLKGSTFFFYTTCILIPSCQSSIPPAFCFRNEKSYAYNSKGPIIPLFSAFLHISPPIPRPHRILYPMLNRVNLALSFSEGLKKAYNKSYVEVEHIAAQCTVFEYNESFNDGVVWRCCVLSAYDETRTLCTIFTT